MTDVAQRSKPLEVHDILARHAAQFLRGLIMSIALRDALARLTVPELKDLVSHLPGAETAGRKDEVIERIVVGMLGPGLQAIWAGLDETQQAAVAEAVHDPLGEYSEQRFRAKYQRVPSFQVAGAKSHGYSGNKSSALGLFIHYVREVASHSAQPVPRP